MAGWGRVYKTIGPKGDTLQTGKKVQAQQPPTKSPDTKQAHGTKKDTTKKLKAPSMQISKDAFKILKDSRFSDRSIIKVKNYNAITAVPHEVIKLFNGGNTLVTVDLGTESKAGTLSNLAKYLQTEKVVEEISNKLNKEIIATDITTQETKGWWIFKRTVSHVMVSFSIKQEEVKS